MSAQQLVTPLPPLAGEELPHIGAGLRFLESPTGYLRELRARHGDTFLLDVFGFNLLVTFSPRGLEHLYQLEESQASFGLATYDMIGFKTPGEIFADVDMRLFYELLMHKRMPAYVAIMNNVVALELERWGEGGEIDIFDAVRTLEQRVGYGLWIAPEAAADEFWPRLKAAFDVLDQERAFVDPHGVLETIKSGKARERQALNDIKQLLPALLHAHDTNPARGYATVDYLREKFAAEDASSGARKLAHNIVNMNQGFLSNLYAAIAWVIVRLAQFPAVGHSVLAELAVTRAQHGADFTGSIEALNELHYLEQVTMESVRLAQRSITLRKVVQTLEFDDGAHTYTVQPGVYITTMLSVTNVQSEALATFNPDNYVRNQPSPLLDAPGKETVSTFGHGKHACPAQRFSHHMCKIVVARVLERFELFLPVENPQPSDRQLGGVARPGVTTRVRLRRIAVESSSSTVTNPGNRERS